MDGERHVGQPFFLWPRQRHSPHGEKRRERPTRLEPTDLLGPLHQPAAVGGVRGHDPCDEVAPSPVEISLLLKQGFTLFDEGSDSKLFEFIY